MGYILLIFLKGKKGRDNYLIVLGEKGIGNYLLIFLKRNRKFEGEGEGTGTVKYNRHDKNL